MNCYLGIDVGQQGAKAALHRADGTLRAEATRSHAIHFPRPGWAEIEPEDMLDGVVEAIAEVVRNAGIDPADVRAIAASGFICTTLLVGADSRAVAPCLPAIDQRATAERDEVHALLEDAWIDQSGSSTVDCYEMPVALRWIARHRPEWLDKAARLLPPAVYVTCRLAGLDAEHSYIEPTQLSGWIFGFDAATRGYAHAQLDALGVPCRLLPRIVECGDIVGHLSEAMAARTGLRAGTPLAAGAGDIQQSALAAGLTEPGCAVDIAGTSSLFCVGVDGINPQLARTPGLLNMLSTLPGQSFYFGYSLTGGLALRWFRDEVCERRDEPLFYAELDRLAEPVRPGPDGVLFFPYLGGYGPELPGASGTFIGLAGGLGRAHMWRAVLESIAFEYRLFTEQFRAAGVQIRHASVVGGGAVSPVWNRIKADVAGLPWQTLTRNDGATLADAALAMLAVGDTDDLAGTVARWSRVQQRHQPDPAAQAVYAQLARLRGTMVHGPLKDAYAQSLQARRISLGQEQPA